MAAESNMKPQKCRRCGARFYPDSWSDDTIDAYETDTKSEYTIWEPEYYEMMFWFQKIHPCRRCHISELDYVSPLGRG